MEPIKNATTTIKNASVLTDSTGSKVNAESVKSDNPSTDQDVNVIWEALETLQKDVNHVIRHAVHVQVLVIRIA